MKKLTDRTKQYMGVSRTKSSVDSHIREIDEGYAKIIEGQDIAARMIKAFVQDADRGEYAGIMSKDISSILAKNTEIQGLMTDVYSLYNDILYHMQQLDMQNNIATANQ